VCWHSIQESAKRALIDQFRENIDFITSPNIGDGNTANTGRSEDGKFEEENILCTFNP